MCVCVCYVYTFLMIFKVCVPSTKYFRQDFSANNISLLFNLLVKSYLVAKGNNTGKLNCLA
jgi:hypothetical protein